MIEYYEADYSCSSWPLDDGRYFAMLIAYDIEASGKTREHALRNLRRKLSGYLRTRADG